MVLSGYQWYGEVIVSVGLASMTNPSLFWYYLKSNSF